MPDGITILKIGGSVITDKKQPRTLNRGALYRIAGEIAETQHHKLILVHGAGSYGHPQAVEKGLGTPESRLVIHESVKGLNSLVVNALVNARVNCAPVHPMSCTILRNGRITSMMTGQIMAMLSMDVVPVLHGDVVLDDVTGASILSGDQIVSHLARDVRASYVGLGSNVDGVLGADGKSLSRITPGTFNDIRGAISGSDSTDVTLGMLGKVQELITLASDGMTSYIFNACKPGNVSRFLKNELDGLGTMITGD